MKGFRTFLLRGNVVDLAVAVVIGVAFNNIVQSLVKDIITPLIAAAGGTPNFGSLTFPISKTPISSSCWRSLSATRKRPSGSALSA